MRVEMLTLPYAYLTSLRHDVDTRKLCWFLIGLFASEAVSYLRNRRSMKFEGFRVSKNDFQEIQIHNTTLFNMQGSILSCAHFEFLPLGSKFTSKFTFDCYSSLPEKPWLIRPLDISFTKKKGPSPSGRKKNNFSPKSLTTKPEISQISK